MDIAGVLGYTLNGLSNFPKLNAQATEFYLPIAAASKHEVAVGQLLDNIAGTIATDFTVRIK
ncbi:hypothetical protein D3C80_1795510 [compost metagenome]